MRLKEVTHCCQHSLRFCVYDSSVAACYDWQRQEGNEPSRTPSRATPTNPQNPNEPKKNLKNFIQEDKIMIHDYIYKPEPAFRYGRSEENPVGVRTYGLELEVSTKTGVRHTSAEDLSERLDAITGGFVYCKSDCSVSAGLEMVTHPASLRAHMSEISWKWFCKTCVKAGFRSHDANESAGLHIHVGRTELGNDAIERDETARKLVLIAARFWPEVVRFSRRHHSQLDQWAARPQIPGYSRDTPPEDVESLLRPWRAHPTNHNARYTAVNLTNAATVEIRVFRGSLNRDTVIAAIQLVDNFCTYAMTHSYADIQRASWLDVARCASFNELDQYLVERGFMPAEALPASSRRRCEFNAVDGREAV